MEERQRCCYDAYDHIEMYRTRVHDIEILCRRLKVVLLDINKRSNSLNDMKIVVQKSINDINSLLQLYQDVMAMRERSWENVLEDDVHYVIKYEVGLLMATRDKLQNNMFSYSAACFGLKAHKSNLTEELVRKEKGLKDNQDILQLISLPMDPSFKFWPVETPATICKKSWFMNCYKKIEQAQKYLESSYSILSTFEMMKTTLNIEIKKFRKNVHVALRRKIQQLRQKYESMNNKRYILAKKVADLEALQDVDGNNCVQDYEQLETKNSISEQIKQLEEKLCKTECSLKLERISLEMHLHHYSTC